MIKTFNNLYTEDEIHYFIDYIEKRKNDKCFNNFNPFKNGKVMDEEHSRMIYSRLNLNLQGELNLDGDYTDKNNKKWIFKSACPYIFYAKYTENQNFGIHTDTGSVFDEKNNIYSKFTLLTYLNDDFDGGNTLFYDDELKPTIVVKPERNKTLMFDIDLFHNSEIINKGTKYWIGTEIVCELLI